MVDPFILVYDRVLREDIMNGNFNDNIILLQAYPLQDVSPLLRLAFQLYDEDTVDLHSTVSMDEPSSSISEHFRNGTPPEMVKGFLKGIRLPREVHYRSLSETLVSAGSSGLNTLMKKVTDIVQQK